MAQLREVRRRIQSVKNTQQVTRAMKMVAAAKLRRSQAAVLAGRPYATNMVALISSILNGDLMPDHSLLDPGEGSRVHLVVIGGDRGLCGGFNTGIINQTEEMIADNPDGTDMTLLGKKIISHFKSGKTEILKQIIDLDDKDLLELSKELSDHVVKLYRTGNYQRIEIVFSEFISVMTQQIVTQTVFPFKLPGTADDELPEEMIYHPSPPEIFDSILPRYILTIFRHAILESMASIHGARMTAMDMATRNAGKLISDLTLQYNQARQAAITRELIEIVSGADAMNQNI